MYDKKRIGRPMKFESVEILQTLIDNYFEECDEQKKPYTVSGLAYALDTDRQTLMEYHNANDENFKQLTDDDRKAYSDTIKRAKERCQKYAEEQLFRTSQVAGVIFSMKNNYGWKDVHELVAVKPNEELSIEEIDKQLKLLES